MHLDTPLDLLHLFFLGFAKYFWGISLPARKGDSNLTLKEKEILEAAETFFASLDQSGCNNSRPVLPSYIILFRGSLVGRHFETILQLAIFFLGPIVDEALRKIWVALGRLAAVAFSPKIDNMDEFTV